MADILKIKMADYIFWASGCITIPKGLIDRKNRGIDSKSRLVGRVLQADM